MSELFHSLNTNEETAALFERVYNICKSQGLDVAFIQSDDSWGGGSFGDKIRYNTRFFNGTRWRGKAADDAVKSQVLLHEMIHAATSYALDANRRGMSHYYGYRVNDETRAALRELNDVYNTIAHDVSFRNEYGISNIWEMLAELSNAGFREKLKRNDLWHRIVDAIRGILGLNKKGELYTKANAALEKMLDNYDSGQFGKYADKLSEEPEYQRFSRRWRDTAARDALVQTLRDAGIEVNTDAAEGQRVLDEANDARLSAKRKRALETVSVSRDEKHQPTVVSSADGAKVLKELDNATEKYENQSNRPNTFIGDIAKALGAERYGSSSEYATFETKNGQVVTIRLADHNAHTSGFDYSGRDNGISIVITPKENAGITNDGKAHVVEYFYDSIKLRRADGKPLADIVRSIKQALFSGEFNDTTGLAERQEVNEGDAARYQFVGEQGARALDQAEEATTRMDNLSVAREMENAKKDARAIKMATGWERGVDGKWRYETPDFSMKPLDEWRTKRGLTLGEIISEDNGLFAAYPELKNLKIKKTTAYGGGSYETNEGNPFIQLGTGHLKYLPQNMDKAEAWTDLMRNTILHEIQHAIQHIEGFEPGANSSTTPGRIRELLREIPDTIADYQEAYDKRGILLSTASIFEGSADDTKKRFNPERAAALYYSAMRDIEEYGKGIPGVPQVDASRFKGMSWDEIKESGGMSAEEVIRTLRNLAGQAVKDVPKLSSFIASIRERLQQLDVYFTPKDIYRMNAGETEARNAERRRNFTKKDRRTFLAADTADVAPEDQHTLYTSWMDILKLVDAWRTEMRNAARTVTAASESVKSSRRTNPREQERMGISLRTCSMAANISPRMCGRAREPTTRGRTSPRFVADGQRRKSRGD